MSIWGGPKGLLHKLQISTYKNNFHSTRMILKRRRLLQPYFKSRKGINRTNLRRKQQDLPSFFSPPQFSQREKTIKYYRWATYGSAVFTRLPPIREQGDVIARTPPYARLPPDAPTRTTILFWFTSSSFLKRPVSLKYWLLRPFFTR